MSISGQSAVQQFAGQTLASGAAAPSNVVMDVNKPAGTSASAVNDAAHGAAAGLGALQGIKGQLLEACNNPTFADAAADICQPQGPSSPRGLFAQNALSIGVSAALTAGATAINPALGVVVAGAAAAHGAISSIAGGVGLAASHEPPPHAALTSAANYYDRGFYQDAEGLVYNEHGLNIAGDSAIDVTKIMASSNNGQPPAQALHKEPTAAELIVQNFGAENVRDQLAVQSAHEEALVGQIARAQKMAELNGYDLAGSYHMGQFADFRKVGAGMGRL